MATQFKQNDIVIVSSVRTPIGNMLGSLSSLAAPNLGAIAIQSALGQIDLSPEDIDEVLMGCVLPAGQGQAPARQAAIHAGIPHHVGATTINKMCGSGMKAVMLANDMLIANPNHIYVAGGMESMTNAPYLLQKARSGYRFGHAEIKDHMLLDGLEDAYDQGKPMGYFAEQTAKKYGFSRQQQDEFAITSLQRAITATEQGIFKKEIAPVTVKTKKGSHVIDRDDGPDPTKLEKITRLKPVFEKDGTVTAANSSSISDGAAALVLMTYQQAQQRHLKPLAKICAQASAAQAPKWFTTAPIAAIEDLLSKTGWTMDEIDLFEINEAFAVVTLAAMDDLKIPHDKVNIHGGACALGHPIGCSGTRVIVTLINALNHHKLKRGVAALCIGGGEATAIAIEVS